MSISASAAHSPSSWSIDTGMPAARSPRPSPTAASRTRSSGRFAMALLAGALQAALHQALDALLAHSLQVLAGLEQRAEGAVGHHRLHGVAVERVERLRPVQRLADAGHAVEVEPAELLHERADLPHERLGRV